MRDASSILIGLLVLVGNAVELEIFDLMLELVVN
jgi:hypothetical protein